MAKNKIIYGGQTLIDLTDANLGATDGDQILSGKTAYGNDGEKITGTCTFDADTSDATANPAEILDGQTAYVDGEKFIGIMPNRGGQIINISRADEVVSIPAGYHDGGGTAAISTEEYEKIIPGNIKDGVILLGVTGTYTGEGVTAQAKTATPYTTQQVILPDANYDYLSQVTVNAISYTETPNAYGTTVTIGDVAP